MVLAYIPAGAVTVTVTVMVQTLLADNDPLLSLMPVSPMFNVPPLLSVREPPQVFVVVVFARVKLVGNGSVKVTPVIASVVGFVSLIITADVPPGAIAFGLNDLLMVTTAVFVDGGAGVEIRRDAFGDGARQDL